MALMAWTYLGPADVKTVIEHWNPKNADTEANLRAATWGVWRVSGRDDLGVLSGQNPGDGAGRRLDVLHPEWMTWVHSGSVEPRAGVYPNDELQSHIDLLRDFVAAGAFEKYPVIFDGPPYGSFVILDGRHRLGVVYEITPWRPDASIVVFRNAREPAPEPDTPA